MFGDAANIPSFTSGHHLLESSVHAPPPLGPGLCTRANDPCALNTELAHDYPDFFSLASRVMPSHNIIIPSYQRGSCVIVPCSVTSVKPLRRKAQFLRITPGCKWKKRESF